jgi:hypothetical protein
MISEPVNKLPAQGASENISNHGMSCGSSEMLKEY